MGDVAVIRITWPRDHSGIMRNHRETLRTKPSETLDTYFNPDFRDYVGHKFAPSYHAHVKITIANKIDQDLWDLYEGKYGL